MTPSPPATATWAAFLRGINVGGNKKVPMAELRAALGKAGFQNVRTLLASGNVLFDSLEKAGGPAGKKFENVVETTFGFHADVILRSAAELRILVRSDPFKGIKVTPLTRLYVTFLPETPEKGALKIPYHSPDGSFRILRATAKELCSMLALTEGVRTPDAMQILEKEYGKGVTTRNWNTLGKVLQLAGS